MIKSSTCCKMSCLSCACCGSKGPTPSPMPRFLPVVQESWGRLRPAESRNEGGINGAGEWHVYGRAHHRLYLRGVQLQRPEGLSYPALDHGGVHQSLRAH